MAQPITFMGRNLPRTLFHNNFDTEAIPQMLKNNTRKNTVEFLKKMGIHADYIEAAIKGEPFGAEVIDLAKYKWMRLFDEL